MVPDQNGVSQAWYIVEIHHSGRKPSIWSCSWCKWLTDSAGCVAAPLLPRTTCLTARVGPHKRPSHQCVMPLCPALLPLAPSTPCTSPATANCLTKGPLRYDIQGWVGCADHPGVCILLGTIRVRWFSIIEQYFSFFRGNKVTRLSVSAHFLSRWWCFNFFFQLIRSNFCYVWTFALSSLPPHLHCSSHPSQKTKLNKQKSLACIIFIWEAY